ncbi:hypothetical protein QYF36_003351 [Acer negundo]|nr:hypothetical protein QYF36_003351 [Acer negundo]
MARERYQPYTSFGNGTTFSQVRERYHGWWAGKVEVDELSLLDHICEIPDQISILIALVALPLYWNMPGSKLRFSGLQKPSNKPPGKAERGVLKKVKSVYQSSVRGRGHRSEAKEPSDDHREGVADALNLRITRGRSIHLIQTQILN